MYHGPSDLVDDAPVRRTSRGREGGRCRLKGGAEDRDRTRPMLRGESLISATESPIDLEYHIYQVLRHLFRLRV